MAFDKWLWRECCDSVLNVKKQYGQIELFKCKCGRTVEGQYLKYFNTEEDAVAARREKKGYAIPGLDGMSEGDLDQFMQQQGGGM